MECREIYRFKKVEKTNLTAEVTLNSVKVSAKDNRLKVKSI